MGQSAADNIREKGSTMDEWQKARNRKGILKTIFSKVSSIVNVHSNLNRTLTFENVYLLYFIHTHATAKEGLTAMTEE